jgi:hypothetical protein
MATALFLQGHSTQLNSLLASDTVHADSKTLRHGLGLFAAASWRVGDDVAQKAFASRDESIRALGAQVAADRTLKDYSVLQQLMSDPSRNVRSILARRFAESDSDEATAALERLARDDDDTVRSIAIPAVVLKLSRKHNSAVLSFIDMALNDPSGWVRLEVLDCLLRTPNPRFGRMDASRLKRSLDSRNPIERKAANDLISQKVVAR